MTNKFQNNSKNGIASPDVKLSLLLSVIKPLHAKWIVNLYHHLEADKEMIVNGFKAGGISEAIENPQDITKWKILSRNFIFLTMVLF